MPVHIETGPSDSPEIALRPVDEWEAEITRVETDPLRAGTTVSVLPPMDQTTVHPAQPHLATIRRDGCTLVLTALNTFEARPVELRDPTSVGEVLAFARQWLQADPMIGTRR